MTVRDQTYAELLLVWARTIEQHQEPDFYVWLKQQRQTERTKV